MEIDGWMYPNMTDVSKEVKDIKDILSIIIVKFNALSKNMPGRKSTSKSLEISSDGGEEQRIEPESGRTYSWSDFEIEFSKTYSSDEVQSYWRNSCKLLPAERKIDPDSGQAYTWNEFYHSFSDSGLYTEEKLKEYWETTCTPELGHLVEGDEEDDGETMVVTSSSKDESVKEPGSEQRKSDEIGRAAGVGTSALPAELASALVRRKTEEAVERPSAPPSALESKERETENAGKEVRSASVPSDPASALEVKRVKEDGVGREVGVASTRSDPAPAPEINEGKKEEMSDPSNACVLLEPSSACAPKLTRQKEHVFSEPTAEAAASSNRERFDSEAEREAEIKRLKGKGKGKLSVEEPAEDEEADWTTTNSREEEIKRLKGLAKGKQQGKGKAPRLSFGMSMKGKGKPAQGRKSVTIREADGVLRAVVEYADRSSLVAIFYDFCFSNNIGQEKVNAYTAQGVLLSGDEDPTYHEDWWPISFAYDPASPALYRGVSLASVDSWE